MAHEIDDDRFFYVIADGKPWHDKGTGLDHEPDFDESIQLLMRGDRYVKLDLMPVIDGVVSDTKLERSSVIFRSDGKEYNTVGKDFELLQADEAFKPMAGELLKSGMISIATGGVLHGGASAFLMAKIVNKGIADIVRGDTVKANLLIATGFDGRMKNIIKDCNTRVVCANTLEIASKEKSNFDFKYLKHTKNIRTKLIDVEQTILGRLQSFEKQVESYQYLASKKIDSVTAQKYIGSVFLTLEQMEGKKEISTKMSNTVSHVIDLIDTQKGLEHVPAIRGTAWQAYNAVSEYVTHEYGRNQESRMHAQYFGESAKINKRAFDLALALN